ncbi:MAG TPA: polyprenyl synthetase family protein [Bacteroidales bacterium]|nr:polyprenyl synthetase family protein [Bacteroidales bacterium]
MGTQESYLRLLNEKISDIAFEKEPRELYEPMTYALTMGGKRIRPTLTLMACEMFKGNVQQALPAALAIEIFHNFTLVHDDIMDVAPIRRGKETVYKKWNTNIGILSGDAMLAKAFEIISESDEKIMKPLVQMLSKVAIEVCEGQQLDMNFEHSEKVTIPEYLAMIRLKTAVLVASSLMAGAIVAGASKQDTRELYLFGENLGMAFQMKDDILDVFGDEKKFGKKKGGDIISKKKTYLYLKAHELAKDKTLNSLIYYFANSTFDNDTKVKAISEIYAKVGVKKHAEKLMDNYYAKALAHLKKIKLPESNKKNLLKLAEQLLVREF